MKKFGNALAAFLSVVMLTGGIVLPVGAQGRAAADSRGGAAGPSSTTAQQIQMHTTTQGVDQAETNVNQRAQEILNEVKGKVTQHSQSRRQTYCTAHKQGLETKLQSLQSNSQKFQSHIDTVLSQTVAYQQANNLAVSNYASLLATAQSDQATSAAAVTALTNLSPSLDCNNTSVVTDIATFKAAAEQARTALLNYRTAVQDLVQALLTAKGGN